MDERETRIEAARKRVEAAQQSVHLADHAVVLTVEGMLEDRRLGVLEDAAWERLRVRVAAAKRAEAAWLAAGRALDEALRQP